MWLRLLMVIRKGGSNREHHSTSSFWKHFMLCSGIVYSLGFFPNPLPLFFQVPHLECWSSLGLCPVSAAHFTLLDDHNCSHDHTFHIYPQTLKPVSLVTFGVLKHPNPTFHHLQLDVFHHVWTHLTSSHIPCLPVLNLVLFRSPSSHQASTSIHPEAQKWTCISPFSHSRYLIHH